MEGMQQPPNELASGNCSASNAVKVAAPSPGVCCLKQETPATSCETQEQCRRKPNGADNKTVVLPHPPLHHPPTQPCMVLPASLATATTTANTTHGAPFFVLPLLPSPCPTVPEQPFGTPAINDNAHGNAPISVFPIPAPPPLLFSSIVTNSNNPNINSIAPRVPCAVGGGEQRNDFLLPTNMTPHFFRNQKLRRGKWTREEEMFADRLIDLFMNGLVDAYEQQQQIQEKPQNHCNGLPKPHTGMGCTGGGAMTLRSYLSLKLHCAPMRISKKYAAQGIGKMVYNKTSYAHLTPAASSVLLSAAAQAEANFYQAVSVDVNFVQQHAFWSYDPTPLLLNAAMIPQQPSPHPVGARVTPMLIAPPFNNPVGDSILGSTSFPDRPSSSLLRGPTASSKSNLPLIAPSVPATAGQSKQLTATTDHIPQLQPLSSISTVSCVPAVGPPFTNTSGSNVTMPTLPPIVATTATQELPWTFCHQAAAFSTVKRKVRPLTSIDAMGEDEKKMRRNEFDSDAEMVVDNKGDGTDPYCGPSSFPVTSSATATPPPVVGGTVMMLHHQLPLANFPGMVLKPLHQILPVAPPSGMTMYNNNNDVQNEGPSSSSYSGAADKATSFSKTGETIVNDQKRSTQQQPLLAPISSITDGRRSHNPSQPSSVATTTAMKNPVGIAPIHTSSTSCLHSDTLVVEDNLPDLMTGFDQVALKLKEELLQQHVENEEQEPGRQPTTTARQLSPGLSSGDELGLECSPPLTSRSFDDFHRFLGTVDLEACTELLSPAFGALGNDSNHGQTAMAPAVRHRVPSMLAQSPSPSLIKTTAQPASDQLLSPSTRNSSPKVISESSLDVSASRLMVIPKLATKDERMEVDFRTLFSAESYGMFSQESGKSARQNLEVLSSSSNSSNRAEMSVLWEKQKTQVHLFDVTEDRVKLGSNAVPNVEMLDRDTDHSVCGDGSAEFALASFADHEQCCNSVDEGMLFEKCGIARASDGVSHCAVLTETSATETEPTSVFSSEESSSSSNTDCYDDEY